MLKVFHIIEETTDQQVVEIHAQNAHEAIVVYMEHCTHERRDSIKKNGHRIIWNFPSEYCVMTAQTEHLIFAKWIHKKGLY